MTTNPTKTLIDILLAGSYDNGVSKHTFPKHRPRRIRLEQLGVDGDSFTRERILVPTGGINYDSGLLLANTMFINTDPTNYVTVYVETGNGPKELCRLQPGDPFLCPTDEFMFYWRLVADTASCYVDALSAGYVPDVE